jgi:hypothetical protein
MMHGKSVGIRVEETVEVHCSKGSSDLHQMLSPACQGLLWMTYFAPSLKTQPYNFVIRQNIVTQNRNLSQFVSGFFSQFALRLTTTSLNTQNKTRRHSNGYQQMKLTSSSGFLSHLAPRALNTSLHMPSQTQP